MLDTITTEIAVGAVCSLITFVASMLWHRGIFKEMLSDALTNHEKIFHRDDIDDKIEKHEKHCPASLDFKAVKTALTFLVVKSGGNLSELGLDK